MNGTVAKVCGVENCRITRCGYTGEDGVEISIPTSYVTDIVRSLLQCEQVQLAGLGARDTLRLVSLYRMRKINKNTWLDVSFDHRKSSYLANVGLKYLLYVEH